jgi:uncharacterized protein (TIGR02677 family)
LAWEVENVRAKAPEAADEPRTIASHSSDFGADAHSSDERGVVSYLVVPEANHYIAIMETLEVSMTDLAPDEIGARLASTGLALDVETLQERLDKLCVWGAVLGRTDASRILRFTDLIAKNWKYTATPVGRQVQRFYRNVLAGAPRVREIPLSSMARVVQAAEQLAASSGEVLSAELIGSLFVNQDDLDGALVGAEDNLAALVDRFDLNDASTGELKTLLVGYATRVALELERGSARVHHALQKLRPRFSELASEAVSASDARALIERGALGASHGGRVEDWEALLTWCDPVSGRAARFALRLVRALPGMHVNLRRLHTSSGAATSRTRALTLAKACLDPEYGPAIFTAALGDHSWRKLHGESEESEGGRLRSWRDGPFVEVPALLRATGRSGARGRSPAARDDTAAKDEIRSARARRAAEHEAAVKEVLGRGSADQLSERGARVALVALLAAVRARSWGGRRTATRDGLSCTLFHTVEHTGSLVAPTWRVLIPGRVIVFHSPTVRPSMPETAPIVEETEPPKVLVAGAI